MKFYTKEGCASYMGGTEAHVPQLAKIETGHMYPTDVNYATVIFYTKVGCASSMGGTEAHVPQLSKM